jgi:hypothetical protein
VTTQWWCKRCRTYRGPLLEGQRPKVRRLLTGYVAVWLSCGHTAAVRYDARETREGRREHAAMDSTV